MLFGYHAEKLQLFLGACTELVFCVRGNQDRVSGRNLLFSVFVSNRARASQNVDLMFPVVAVVGCETSGFYCEVTHQKGWRAILLVDQPFYLHIPRALLSYSGVRRFAHAGPIQLRFIGM
jgi:hypothetical protein